MNQPTAAHFDMQKFMDAISESARETRSDYHLTLGELIEQLELITRVDSGDLPVVTDKGAPVMAIMRSYRGYYSDCAIEPAFAGNQSTTASALLAAARSVLGTKLEGYKGGEFLMGAKTPLWVSGYGTSSGLAVVSMVVKDKRVVLITKQVDN